ncbi:hypothetical protein [Gordonia humi]|uniref:Uncharacterized protein n=1 Tax=Gordonia humi TaxID=686429 RepID=A0A840EWZ9_9ACTN|nr:hypothetical protein [Gordonia humi]MBB4137525.1 hypothetical protein [Gordonia humi]
MAEDAGDGLSCFVGDVFLFVDDDLVEQGAVEEASFGGFALAVEVVQVGEDAGDLVESFACGGVCVREVVEPGVDDVEAGTDAVLFTLEQVEWDRVGVVGLDEFEPFGVEFVSLGFEEFPFVVAGGFELVEHLVQHGAHGGSFLLSDAIGAVGGFDALFDARGEDC